MTGKPTTNSDLALNGVRLRASSDPGFDLEIDPISPYAVAGGCERYFRGRATDGGRPVLYAEFVRSSAPTCSMLVGLGCGDSAVEHAVRAAYAPHVPAYIGVDASDAMLDLSRGRMGESDSEFLQADFLSPATIALLERRLPMGGIVMLAGRTFGNLDTTSTLHALNPLAKKAILFFDFFSCEDPGRFRERVSQIAVTSRDFLLAPLLRLGVEIPTGGIECLVAEEATALRCDFGIEAAASSDALPHRYRLFSIRTFKLTAFLELLRAEGVDPAFHLDMPDQILPMTMLGVRW